MNKLEQEFFTRLKLQYSNVYYEPFRCRLANGVEFVPDFMVVELSRQVIFYEVKGGVMQDDAAVKLKVAAQQYPLFKFILAWKDFREWKEQLILP